MVGLPSAYEMALLARCPTDDAVILRRRILSALATALTNVPYGTQGTITTAAITKGSTTSQAIINAQFAELFNLGYTYTDSSTTFTLTFQRD